MSDRFSSLNSALTGINKSDIITLGTFCEEAFNIAKKSNCFCIPFKIKCDKNWSPNNLDSWIKGTFYLQNMDFSHNDIGSIVASDSVHLYFTQIQYDIDHPGTNGWKILD